MKIARVASVAVLGLALGVMALSANAAPRTYYDLETHSVITIDPDRTREQATAAVAPAPRTAIVNRNRKPDPKFDRQVVAYATEEAPGTIIIDTKEKFLYYVQDGGRALRMGVGVGREGFGWTGVVQVGGKQENPKWCPPAEMVERQPELAKYTIDGMPGGEGNPLGVRALYLFDDKGKDTLYRIHGTIEPWTIGLNVSSGCIRLLNENVTELYEMVGIGTKVIVM